MINPGSSKGRILRTPLRCVLIALLRTPLRCVLMYVVAKVAEDNRQLASQAYRQ